MKMNLPSFLFDDAKKEKTVVPLELVVNNESAQVPLMLQTSFVNAIDKFTYDNGLTQILVAAKAGK